MAAYEEKKKHSSKLVPFSYYECLIPDYFANVPLHWHSEFEINYIISGCAEFICGDNRFISSKGDIIILPPNILHAIYPHKSNKQIYDTIVFNAEILGISENNRCSAKCIKPLANGLSKINTCITKEHTHYNELQKSVETIFSCAKGNTPQLDMLMKSELLRFFWLLWEHGDIVQTAKDSTDKNEIIRSVIEYMNKNYAENITVEQLSEIAHISKSYFMRRFREAAGVGAIEYLSQIRIKKACEALVETNNTSSEIAFACGFRNLSNFNRQFKDIVGCTPREYRKIK
ncbi:MAG: AraC family transcriptional regulator [Clostridiales bacterium]|nr:AraC family transcriptional regulator [Clostridiales bacterium]